MKNARDSIQVSRTFTLKIYFVNDDDYNENMYAAETAILQVNRTLEGGKAIRLKNGVIMVPFPYVPGVHLDRVVRVCAGMMVHNVLFRFTVEQG